MSTTKLSLRILPLLMACAIQFNAYGQQYAVGDIVENFTLINRANNQEVSLYDLEGKIIFLEWFAYWCPFCQAAAGDIGPGIVEYYNTRGGNPNDLEVMHVSLNLQGGAEGQTQNFVNFFNLGLVLNDFDRAIAGRFQPMNQPIFAIINGVANSSSHQQWELLYTELGYQSLNAPIEAFRSVIDSVGAAVGDAPMITVQPASQTIESGSMLDLSVTFISDGATTFQWKLNDVDIPGATSNPYSVPNAQSANAGQYTVAVTNPNGTTLSEAATIDLILGFTDSLIDQGVPADQRGFDDDPDRDGIINAYEFLSRSNANDPSSGAPPAVFIQTIDGDAYLMFSFYVDPSIRSIVPQVQFSVTPGFSTDFLSPMLEEEITEGGLMRFTFRSTTRLQDAAQFARLQMSVN